MVGLEGLVLGGLQALLGVSSSFVCFKLCFGVLGLRWSHGGLDLVLGLFRLQRLQREQKPEKQEAQTSSETPS